jgi:hypothetical protein
MQIVVNLKFATTSRISDCIAGKSQRGMDQSHTTTLPERQTTKHCSCLRGKKKKDDQTVTSQNFKLFKIH